jgi:hypothetical protein
VGVTDDPGASRAMLEEDTMNPNFNWAIVAERMQRLQAEAGATSRLRAAARARQARRPRRGLAFALAGLGRRHPGTAPAGS